MIICVHVFSRDRSRSPRQSGEEDPLAINDDELSVVGIPDDTEIAQIFEPSGMNITEYASYVKLICYYFQQGGFGRGVNLFA